MTVEQRERRLGAWPLDEGRVEFRVWAPGAERVAVCVGDGLSLALQRGEDGIHEGVVPARAGDDYWYLAGDQQLPDPCSRWQPQGLRGPSRVLAPPSVDPRGMTLEKLVIYELHVGTFSPDGTFEAAIPYLNELAALGVTAIEIMPVAEFPGARGWGYDGVYISAAQSSYGGPHGLARLVQAAHSAGLAVILDVVYNHVGASGVQALEAFGPYFTGEHETPWGRAIDYAERSVREWACQSACQWIADFGIDGLRLDAIHSIYDPSEEHIVAEIARRVHAIGPGALVIGEIGMDDPEQHGAPACDAIWVDDFHHALHVLLTGERDGYYEPFGRVEQLADSLRHTPPKHFVVYAQNHDQVGNRAFGDRLAAELRPLAAFCTLLSPFVPLLFMGEEYGERAPFQFFSDHVDPEIAEATRTGRRAEFAAFASFSGEEIPDPQDPETYEHSKLTRESDPEIARLYADLLAARHRLPGGDAEGIAFDEVARWLRVRRGGYELVCNFAHDAQSVAVDGTTLDLVTHAGTSLSPTHVDLPPLSGALIR